MGAVKIPGICPTGIRRAVIAGKDDDGIILQALDLQLLKQFSDLFVQIADHCCIGGMRIPIREISVPPGIRLFIAKFFNVVTNPLLRRLQG